jgi:phage-related minor tail protein/predicted  nucleic acid-binding Zn-ribbon protein
MAFDLLLKIGSDITGFSEGMTGMSSEIYDKVTQSVKNFDLFDYVGDKIGGVWGAVAIGAATGATAIGKELYKIGSDFDGMMDTIRVQTGATGPALEALGESAKNVFANVPASIEDVSKALAELHTRTGFTGPALESLTTQTINLSRVTGEDLSGIIASTTRVFGDWSDEIGTNTGPALDTLYKVSQSTGIGVTSLSESVVKFGGPLRQLGFDFETSAALIGKFEKEGVNADLVLGSLRIGLAKMAKEGVTDTNAALLELIDRVKGAGTAGEATRIAMELFGAKAGPDMAAAIKEGRFELDPLLEQLRNSPETINGAAKDTEDLTEQWKTFSNAISVLVEPAASGLFSLINEVGVGALQSLLKWIQDTTKDLTPAVEGFKNFYDSLGPIPGIIGDVVGWMGKIAIEGTVSFIKSVGDGFNTMGSLINGAVSAVQTVVTWLGTLWEKLGPIPGAVQAVSEKVGSMVTAIGGIPGVAGFFDGLKTKTKDAGEAAGTAAVEVTKLTTAHNPDKVRAFKEVLEATKLAFTNGEASAKDLKKATDDYNKAVEDAGKKAGTTTGQVDTLTESKKRAAAAAKAAKDESHALETALKNLGGESYNSEQKVKDLNTQMAAIDKAFRDGKISAETHAAAVATYRQKTDEALNPTKDLKDALGLLKVNVDDSEKKTVALNTALETARLAYFNGKLPLNDYIEAQANHKKALDDLKDPLANLNAEMLKVINQSGTAKTNIDNLNLAMTNSPQLLRDMNTEVINQGLAQSATNATIATSIQYIGSDLPKANTDAGTSWGTHATAAGTAMTGIQTGMGAMVTAVGAQGAALAADLTAKLWSGEGSWTAIGAKALDSFITGDWTKFKDNAISLVGGLASGAIAKLFGGGNDSLKSAHATGTAALPGDWGKFKDGSLTHVGGFVTGAIGKLFGSSADSLKSQHGTAVTAMAGSWESFKTGAMQHISGFVTQGINALVSGTGSFGDRIKGMLTSLVGEFANMAAGWISEATGLASRITSILGSINVPSGLVGVLGGGGGAAGAAGSVAGGAAGAGGDAAGAVAGAIGSSVTGLVGAISGVATAVSSIVGNFQMSAMNKALDNIVLHTLQTANDLANLRRDDWDRETHLMRKIDDVFQFTWLKMDDIWGAILDLGGGVTVGTDNGTLTLAAQAIEGHTGTLLTDVAGFRGEVSTGFSNSMTKANDLWRTLQNIETNTKKVEVVVEDTTTLGTIAEGLRNINLSLQGISNVFANDVLSKIQSNTAPIGEMRTLVVNGINGVTTFLLNDLKLWMSEISGLLSPVFYAYDRLKNRNLADDMYQMVGGFDRMVEMMRPVTQMGVMFTRQDVDESRWQDRMERYLIPQYQYYDRVEKAIAARVSGGNTVSVNISEINLGSTQNLSRDTIDRLAATIGTQITRSMALQGAS